MIQFVLLPNLELAKGNTMGDSDVRTVHLRRKTMTDMRYDLETLNPNSFVCGQKHKVWVLVFLK